MGPAMSDPERAPTEIGSSTRPSSASAGEAGITALAGTTDLVEEWGYQSFPASDPPQAWSYEQSRIGR